MSIAELSSKRIDARSSSLDVLLLQQLIPLCTCEKKPRRWKKLVASRAECFFFFFDVSFVCTAIMGKFFGLEVAANQVLSSTTIIHGKGSVLLLLLPHQCVILKNWLLQIYLWICSQWSVLQFLEVPYCQLQWKKPTIFEPSWPIYNNLWAFSPPHCGRGLCRFAIGFVILPSV